jgi:hypothetical protein
VNVTGARTALRTRMHENLEGWTECAYLTRLDFCPSLINIKSLRPALSIDQIKSIVLVIKYFLIFALRLQALWPSFVWL